jgi:TolB-like protein/Tfp pilus assembly protein PilF/predicted Ser/Thr protein kinase
MAKCPACGFDASSDSHFCPRCGARFMAAGDGAISVTKSLSPPGAHPPGSFFAGRYKIIGAAGEGGMGVVYKAEDAKLGRTVALKFLPAALARDPEAKKRFLREARAAAILDHPNICPLYEVDEAEGEMFLTMAFVEGRSLKERVAEGRLPLVEAVGIAVQAAEGLRAAHERGVVHRDVKPANIMLGRDGQVRITDFGLASVEGGVELTRPQTVLGTPAYMSPEQVRGERTDSRTDIWSFGCTLFEMTAGRRPFAGESLQETRSVILNDAPPDPASLRADLPPGLSEVILKCLRKRPGDRYPDFDAVLAALRSEAVMGRDAAEAGRGPSPAAAVPSVAVLPFVDMSPGKDQEYFGEGLAEELIHALARVQGLRVVARTSAFALKGMKLDLREVGKMLGVRAVLEGSVRKAGDRLRVTAQLIDAATGMHIWSERYDREERDVFAIQDEITAAIVEHLKVTLLSGEKAALRKRSTADTEAYNHYLKGLYFVARPDAASYAKALDFFRAAIDKDPGFAQAYAGTASAYASLGIMNLAPPSEMWPKAKAFLQKALALDDDLAEAHAAAAAMAFWFEWDWDAAGRSLDRVLALNPGDAMSHGMRGWFLLNRRRFDDSIREVKKALELDPLMPLFYAWSVGLNWSAGRPDDALREFAKAMEIDPNLGLAYFHAGMAYYQKGLLDKAAEAFEKGKKLFAPPGWADGMLGLISLKKGDRAGAARTLERALESGKMVRHVSPTALAWLAAEMGRLDLAFELLDKGYEQRDTLMGFVHIYSELLTPALAADPRFKGVLAKMKLDT